MSTMMDVESIHRVPGAKLVTPTHRRSLPEGLLLVVNQRRFRITEGSLSVALSNVSTLALSFVPTRPPQATAIRNRGRSFPFRRIERNNHGHTVIAYVKDEARISLYRTQEVDKVTNKVSEKIGWDTTEKSNSFAIDSLARDLEDGKCIPHSAETFEECRTFVHGECGKMGGLRGKHDDRVMALSLANVAAQQEGIGNILFV